MTEKSHPLTAATAEPGEVAASFTEPRIGLRLRHARLTKGLSLKEVATVRATSERTVRAQARSLYAKAGLTGRAALSAFFLEDLLAPIEGVR